ncbi:MAG: CoA transferase [Alphaproteobacteria bacterium]|nr:MAG: CoA transferase [Alphaproteobacteria bacterium]
MAEGPLAGILVVDLSRVLAGPYCTMILGELGARVIKVERPGRGDDAREIGPFIESAEGARVSAYFAGLNRGKESIALDLSDDADRRIFEALVARADVLVENFRPGVMARLGYGYEALAARYPRLVYAAVSGFGQTGPYRDRAAYDLVVQAMGGIMSITGHPGGPPTRVGTSIGDIAAGLFAAIGICAALQERGKTGRGRMVDVAMLDAQVAILENAIARYEATGCVPGPLGARHPSITPFAAYRAEDGYLVIAAGNDALFARLANVLGHPEWATDPRFASNADRTAHAEALQDEIEAVLAAEPVTHWLDRLGTAGIPCGPINDIAAVLADPQVAARNMVVTAADPVAGALRMAGNPVKMSGVPDPATRRPAPALDADRARILAELGRAPKPS